MASKCAPTLIERRFVSEKELELITGRSRKTFQKDRLLSRGAPFYKVGGSILYDLQETISWIKSQRGGGQTA